MLQDYKVKSVLQSKIRDESRQLLLQRRNDELFDHDELIVSFIFFNAYIMAKIAVKSYIFSPQIMTPCLEPLEKARRESYISGSFDWRETSLLF